MICTNCNAQLPDDAAFCGNCGSPVTPPAQVTTTPQGPVLSTAMQSPYHIGAPNPQVAGQQAEAPVAQPDKASVPGVVFGFLFPIVGLILFLAWKGKRPVAAKYSGIAALVGFCIGLVMNLVRFAVVS